MWKPKPLKSVIVNVKKERVNAYGNPDKEGKFIQTTQVIVHDFKKKTPPSKPKAGI